MECGYSRGVSIFAGAIATIASRLKVDRKVVKELLAGTDFRGIQWPKPTPAREAIMAAVAALES